VRVVGGSNPLVPTIFFLHLVPQFLLTNDDGIDAEGLHRLEGCLEALGEITVVAPDRERSAVSHGLTISVPLELKEVGERRYTLNGTPADCVIFALRHVFQVPPDLVISGINHGANLGDDIMYSGTVAAAREASRHGIPAIAFSQAYDEKPIRFEQGVKFIPDLVSAFLSQKPNGGFCLNVNLPVRRIRGIKITRQGCSAHFPHFNVLDRRDPQDLSAEPAARPVGPDMPFDFAAILEHYVSVTPLQRDQTDYAVAGSLLGHLPSLMSRHAAPGMVLIDPEN
jgi:5'-nucleotidase